jgi:hypothetical protein
MCMFYLHRQHLEHRLVGSLRAVEPRDTGPWGANQPVCDQK